MHYVIVTVGTRGDVQPLVALGKGLVAAGHAVTLVAHTDFEDFVQDNGLQFRPIGGSFREILESPEGRAWIESGDSLFRYIKAFSRWVRPFATRCLAEVEDVVRDADVLLLHPMAAFGVPVAEQLNIPFAFVSFVPFVMSGELAPIMFPRMPAWSWPRLFLQKASLDALTKVTADIYAEAREKRGQQPWLEPPWQGYAEAGVPFLHLFSEQLLPRPTDWPKNVHVTGFCFLEEETEPTIPDALRAFLDEGEPPIYLGFGSMTGRDPEALARIAIEAIEAVGVRAVVLTGWGGVRGAEVPASIHLADSVPHDWLFPRVRAVVHHGGAGTTAAGLRAGKPTLVVSFFGDQPFWGYRVQRAELGPPPLHRTRLTAPRLAASIRALLDEPRYAENAARVGEIFRAEDGVQRAVDVLSAALPGRKS